MLPFFQLPRAEQGIKHCKKPTLILLKSYILNSMYFLFKFYSFQCKWYLKMPLIPQSNHQTVQSYFWATFSWLVWFSRGCYRGCYISTVTICSLWLALLSNACSAFWLGSVWTCYSFNKCFGADKTCWICSKSWALGLEGSSDWLPGRNTKRPWCEFIAPKWLYSHSKWSGTEGATSLQEKCWKVNAWRLPHPSYWVNCL